MHGLMQHLSRDNNLQFLISKGRKENSLNPDFVLTNSLASVPLSSASDIESTCLHTASVVNKVLFLNGLCFLTYGHNSLLNL